MGVKCTGCGQVWSSVDDYAGIEEHGCHRGRGTFAFFTAMMLSALYLWLFL